MRERPLNRRLLTFLRILPVSLLGGVVAPIFADETNAPLPVVSGGVEATNFQDTLRAVLDLESQLKANLLVIEQNGQEAREAADHNADLLSKGLQTIETAVADQGRALSERGERELRAVQSSTKVLVTVGSTFAALASVAILMVAYLQYRMSKVWAGISNGLPASWLAGDPKVRELGPGESRAVGASTAEEVNLRLVQALERLDSRVHDLERSSAPASSLGEVMSLGDNGDPPLVRVLRPTTEGCGTFALEGEDRISALLEQGQSMVKQNEWENALKCFNEVLALDPNHSEALVKKGAALEHLKKLNEAFDCYDQAIAVDDSMTIAYLHKGGLCSRLERFKEALECYEKALKSHDGW
jgi:tetratricopeptide (TPR) repeat protein